MADEFGQLVRGLHGEGEALVSTDTFLGIVGEDESNNYHLLQFDSATGNLKVTGGMQYQVDDVAGGTDTGTTALVVRDDALTTLTPADGDYTVLRVNDEGRLWVTISGEDVNVTATDLDIRDLVHTQDSVALGDGTGALVDVLTGGTIDALQVAISDGTNQLAVNADGSINVSMSGAGVDNTYIYGSANLVKDTATTVVTETPASVTEFIKAIVVSGAGLCEWKVYFGTTSSEAVIMSFWTTPSNPTHYMDVPDSLNVTTAQTIYIEAINRERRPSPASDFTGHATLIRNT